MFLYFLANNSHSLVSYKILIRNRKSKHNNDIQNKSITKKQLDTFNRIFVSKLMRYYYISIGINACINLNMTRIRNLLTAKKKNRSIIDWPIYRTWSTSQNDLNIKNRRPSQLFDDSFFRQMISADRRVCPYNCILPCHFSA